VEEVGVVSFLRRFHGLTLRDGTHGCLIRKTMNVEPLLIPVERSQLRWFVVNRISKERSTQRRIQTL